MDEIVRNESESELSKMKQVRGWVSELKAMTSEDVQRFAMRIEQREDRSDRDEGLL